MPCRIAGSVLLAAVLAGCASRSGTLADSLGGWPHGEWARHTIDDSSLGADGVRLADLDGDGLVDIVSPWEQGGLVRVYLNPGAEGLRERWPAVTVGEVGDPEDAFFLDVDGDGFLDVVSSSEGGTRSVHVHWAPADHERLLDPSAWVTEPMPEARGRAQWMYAVAADLDGKAGTDIVAGSKNDGARIGWFRAPEKPRNLAEWAWHPLYDAAWVMTLRVRDMDADGDQDIVATDRRGSGRGALWLENPGPEDAASGDWAEHRIGPVGDHEAMHHAIGDLDGDGRDDVLVAVKGGPLLFHRRLGGQRPRWETYPIAMPQGAGGGKSVGISDIDLDGQADLVVACEHASEGKIGVFWLSHAGDPTDPAWFPESISGPDGFIYDLVQPIDLDGDGDIDIVTLEEKGPYLAEGYQGRELGVIWYENPVRAAGSALQAR